MESGMWKTFRLESSVAGSPGAGSTETSWTMAFIQTIEFTTEQRDDMLELMGRWSADAMANGTAQRGTMAADRGRTGRYIMAVWFESPEAAAENSDRPETGAFAEQFAGLCSDGPHFHEYDVVEMYER